MKKTNYSTALKKLKQSHQKLLKLKNPLDASWYNGVLNRYQYPILTADHIPLNWRYDLNAKTNPFLQERLGVNAVFNAGAIEMKGKIHLVCRVEGYDRKSFFAVAESKSGTQDFQFWDYPVEMPEVSTPDTNIYDMRLVKHEDGWIYGLFCTERKDPTAPKHDTSSAVAQCAIARTHDLKNWERLADLQTPSAQQRNVVLHPEFIDGQYALYTRPQSGFIDTGSGGGIGWGLSKSMENARIKEEIIVDPRTYHTIKETKNGAGPAPIKTKQGWLHIAHGVRNCAAGLRYVLYAFLCDLKKPWIVTHRPGGYLLAPIGEERIGDVSNVVFSNGVAVRPNGDLFLYYGSSDTRLHVATSTVDRLLDYVKNTPEDGLRTKASVQQRIDLIHKNKALKIK